MIITCHFCKTDCLSLARWYRHLLSDGHQAALKKAASTSVSVVKEDSNSESEMMMVPGATTIFLLQPSSSSEVRHPRDVVTLAKFATLGVIHDFYIHSDQTNPNRSAVVVRLERRHGLSNETIIQESKSFGFLATPFVASTPADWNGVILSLNNADEVDQKLSVAVVEISAAKKESKLMSLSLPVVPVPLSLESSGESSNSNGLDGTLSKRRKEDTASVIRRTTNDLVNEKLLLHFKDDQLTQAQAEKREAILRNLDSCLGTWFSRLQIEFHPYGSYFTGLGDHSSDLDVTMTGHEIMEVSAVEFAKEVKTVLTNYRCNGKALFAKIQMILRPVELVRFTDASTGISCDLSFGNLLAVRNSELIAFIVGLDPRIRQLVLLVRRWGSFYKLAGCTQLKNYTIALLVFVFLARKMFIPTISTLQSLGEEEIIRGWNAGFTRDAEAVRSLLSGCRSVEESNYHANANLLQLTRDFFHFFASENFEDNLICCLTAESIPKSYFNSFDTIKEHIPHQYERFRRQMEFATGKGKIELKIKPFTVQDPFNLTSNVGKSVLDNVLKKLKPIVMKTAEYLSSLNESPSSCEVELFPTSIQSEPDEPELNVEKVIDEISPLLGQTNQGISILKEIKDRGCQKIKLNLDQKFSDIFAEFNSGQMNEESQSLMHQLWFKFARLFIGRVWNQSYLLHCDQTMFTKNVVGGVVLCRILNVHGPAFHAGQLFQIREVEKRKNKVSSEPEEDPLEVERAVRLCARRAFKPELIFRCLAVLYNDKDLGPHFILFNPYFHNETPLNKTMLKFVTLGVKKMFCKYQIYLLRKWIANGQNINLL